jgi:hypothetical protein
MFPCVRVLPAFRRLSQQGLHSWKVHPGQRRIVSMLRLSHSEHLAVCTLTALKASADAEHAVTDGLEPGPGVCGGGGRRLAKAEGGVWAGPHGVVLGV